MSRTQGLFGLLLIASQLGTGLAQAQSPRALVDATIIDPSKEVSQFVGTVVIEGDRITQVGPSGDVPIPDSAERIDLSGKFLLPGLIDAHVHFIGGISEAGFEPASYDDLLEQYPRWGVTTVFEAASALNSFSDGKRASSERGLARARYFGVGQPFSSALNPNPAADEIVASIEALSSAGVEGVKIMHAESNTVGSLLPTPQYSSEVLERIIAESHARSLFVVVHASNRQTAETVLGAGANALMHGLYDEPFGNEFLGLMQQAGAYYVPTQGLFEAQADALTWAHRLREFDSKQLMSQADFDQIQARGDSYLTSSFPLREKLQILRENLRRIQNAGIPVVLGTDSGVPPMVLGVSTQFELVLYVEAGLSPVQALRAGTVNAARMIGVFDELGSIDEGKYADLIVLSANPIENIRNVREIDSVYVGGVLVE